LRLKRAKKTNGAMALLEEEVQKREKAEEVRVFYVSATRAKAKMICLLRDEKTKPSGAAVYLKQAGAWPTEGMDHLELGDLRVPIHSTRWSGRKLRKTVSPAPEILGPDWEPHRLAGVFLAHRKEFEGLKDTTLILSPTSLLQEQEKWRVLDEEEGLPFNPQPILVGHLCHKVMEDWDFSAKVKPATLDKLLEKAARIYEVVPEDPDGMAAIQEARQILLGFFKSATYEKLTHVIIKGKEIPFLYPLGVDGGDQPRLMRGVIDLLYESNGHLVVGDYKTNKLDRRSQKEWSDHYRSQGDCYREAIRKTLGKEVAFELIFLRQ
jgi:ATP-dependent helicase/nuclease subunit A